MGVVIFIVTGLVLFTYKSTAFNLEGFILVILASVITGLRWACAQLTLQKEELGMCVSVCCALSLPVCFASCTVLYLCVYAPHVCS